jgi:ubiquinone/menaquinone biosynthesis C-methylase UbiE
VKLRRYGLDAPWVLLTLVLGGAAGLVVQAAMGRRLRSSTPVRAVRGYLGVSGVSALVQAAYMVVSSLWGKVRLWQEILDDAPPPPDAQVLELGPGHGWLLVEVARRLGPQGRVTGIDLWRPQDQAGNRRRVTEANLAEAGVADRVRLVDGDFTDLPFDDASFDLVLANLAVHNLPDPEHRAAALTQAARVLRPGGRAVLVDYTETATSVAVLSDAGLLARRSGPRLRMWPPVRVITASRP